MSTNNIVSLSIGISLVTSVMLVIMYLTCVSEGISFLACLLTLAIILVGVLIVGLGVWFIIRAFL
jgi:hypothetical protein